MVTINKLFSKNYKSYAARLRGLHGLTQLGLVNDRLVNERLADSLRDHMDEIWTKLTTEEVELLRLLGTDLNRIGDENEFSTVTFASRDLQQVGKVLLESKPIKIRSLIYTTRTDSPDGYIEPLSSYEMLIVALFWIKVSDFDSSFFFIKTALGRSLSAIQKLENFYSFLHGDLSLNYKTRLGNNRPLAEQMVDYAGRYLSKIGKFKQAIISYRAKLDIYADESMFLDFWGTDSIYAEYTERFDEELTDMIFRLFEILQEI